MAIRQPLPRPSPPGDDDWSAYDGMEMTEADFVKLDDANETSLEYFDGAAWEKGVVDANRRFAANEVLFAFGLLLRRSGGEAGPEGRVRLATGRRLKPDAAYWLPGTPAGNDSLPTVAVEVRSPGQSLAAQRRKCRMYREAGVPIAWFIDPARRVVEDFEGSRDGEQLAANATLRSALLPGFELTVASLWRTR